MQVWWVTGAGMTLTLIGLFRTWTSPSPTTKSSKVPLSTGVNSIRYSAFCAWMNSDAWISRPSTVRRYP